MNFIVQPYKSKGFPFLCATQRNSFSSSCYLGSHYKILGVPPEATKGQIKANFYQLSKLHHPDVSKDPRSKDIFHAAREAYAVLSNDRQRREYDRSVAIQRTAEAANGRPHLRRQRGSYTAWPETRRQTGQAWEFSSRQPSGWHNQHRHSGPQQHSHPGRHYQPGAEYYGSSSPLNANNPFASLHVRRATGRNFSADERVRNESSVIRALQVMTVIVLISVFGTGWSASAG